MKKAFLVLFALTVLCGGVVGGAGVEYDVIIVRSDLPYDWTVAQAYSQRAHIPIITTSPSALDVSTREQLLGFRGEGAKKALILGGEAAISPAVESEIADLGFVTHRISEVDRYGTSARVAVELYGHAGTAVLVSGEDVAGLLDAQRAAFQTEAPILFVKAEGVPASVKEGLKLLGAGEAVLVPAGLSEKVKDELAAYGLEVREFAPGLQARSAPALSRAGDIAVGLVLGLLLSLALRRRGKEKVPYNVLTEDEERVIKAIESHGGVINQDALYEVTGFSRPKISRIVSDLVERDMVEKEQFKRTFKLKIKKEFVKG
ncbi:MAG: hypothetical protein D6733_00265 [Methanobacteriota archaeon]|nr:MAG: hypothetical protein D6733_00265 [Euryarchaeota archaeon]